MNYPTTSILYFKSFKCQKMPTHAFKKPWLLILKNKLDDAQQIESCSNLVPVRISSTWRLAIAQSDSFFVEGEGQIKHGGS